VSVTHVAGPVVFFRILNRVIQRCAVCGEKLADNLNACGPLNQDGSPPTFPTWPERRLIRCEGEPGVQLLRDVGCFINDPLPDDFCLILVED